MIVLAPGHAQAGWWQRFCERNLVADAPAWADVYLDDELLDAWYLKEAARCALTNTRSNELRVIGNEMRSRTMTARRTEMLLGYQHYEEAM